MLEKNPSSREANGILLAEHVAETGAEASDGITANEPTGYMDGESFRWTVSTDTGAEPARRWL